MTDTIHLEIDRAEGSLQRVIGLIERRGFHIDHMAMDRQGGPTRNVTLGVRARDDQRCVHVLGRQIDRLVGVRRSDAPSAFPEFHLEAVRCAP